MIEAITSTIITYYIIGIILSYSLFLRTLKIKEIETGMKILLFFIIPLVFLFRGILEYFLGGLSVFIFDVTLLTFWIIMLIAVIKRTKGIERVVLVFLLTLTGTFGAVLILSTIKQNKKKILKDKFFIYIRNNIEKTIETFKEIKINYLYVILLDIAFYSLVILSFSIGGIVAMSTISGVNDVTANLEMMTPEQLEIYTDGIYAILFQMLALFILFVLVSTILITIFKGLIWAIVKKTKLNFKGYLKFFTVNLFAVVLFLLVFFVVSTMATKGMMGLGVVLLLIFTTYLMHLITITYYTFMDEKKIFKTIKKAFMKSIKIHKFIIPYLITFIIMVILNLIINLIGLINEVVLSVISTITTLLLIAWFRFYITKVLKNVK